MIENNVAVFGIKHLYRDLKHYGEKKLLSKGDSDAQIVTKRLKGYRMYVERVRGRGKSKGTRIERIRAS